MATDFERGGEGIFVGDVVSDDDRHAADEWLLGDECAQCRSLVQPAWLDLEHRMKDGGAAAGDTPVPPSQQVGSQKSADSNTVDVEAKTRS